MNKTLAVPYFTQPTSVTCQATVLRMFASYLERSAGGQSVGASEPDILKIWAAIKKSPERPSTTRNAHANMKWWLERNFPLLRFVYSTTADAGLAVSKIVDFINAGYPVLVSVSHVQVEGHIILVVGYENYLPNACSVNFSLIAHDPYGQFDPSLKSKLFGGRRWEGGASLLGGGEKGPGRFVKIPASGASRQRPGDGNAGTFYLLSVKR